MSTLPETRPDAASWQDMTPSPAVLMDSGRQHKVTAVREWRNEHGSTFTDWRAHCGADGVLSFAGALDRAGSTRLRKALCPQCWGAQ